MTDNTTPAPLYHAGQHIDPDALTRRVADYHPAPVLIRAYATVNTATTSAAKLNKRAELTGLVRCYTERLDDGRYGVFGEVAVNG